MNSAPQIETLAMSEAELDNVSGGLSPHASVVAGPTAISGESLLAQAGALQEQVLGAVGQYNGASVTLSV